MPQIQCLPSHVADLIAAGEVVERPASVAKELLENAIDAGAAAIVVELERGGLTYLRITDNGCGIAPTELPTAFLRHATSKLRTADDLAAIGTLGFRGEALAAISAVSRVDIFSRQKGAETGAVLHLEGGVSGEVTEAGCPEGTTICVRDLFYNTPARMKFMKKDSAEAAAISSIVQQLALSHPDISFKLIRDGAEVLHTPGDGKLLSAVYAAMGRDFARGLMEVRGSGGEVEVTGYVTSPASGHGTRGRQVFFVNGRVVKSQLLTAALEEAYRNRLLKGKFPGCVIHVSLPADRVDVNVHPAKTVVKFVSDKEVFDALYYTVRDALDGEHRPAAPAQQTFYQTMTVQQYKEKAAPVPEVKKPLGSYTVRPAAAPVATKEQLFGQVRDVAPAEEPPVREAPVKPAAEKRAAPAPVEEKITPPAPVKEEAPQPAPAPQQQTLEQGRTPWRMVGEVLRTYIVCEDESENLWLIDKHAAHERIRFDALKADDHPLMSQILLAPLTVTLPSEETAAVLEHLDTLRRLGFVCEDFGGDTILVREVPADIRTGDAAATLEELAQKLLLGRIDPEGVRDELYHTMACKSAIKAGMITDARELAALVEKVQSGEIAYCPHGRPVAVKLTKNEIEKMFKRA